jgi:hypothetical protein
MSLRYLNSMDIKQVRSRCTLRLFLFMATGLVSITARAQQPAPKPAPDLIVFTNGDQLTGTLERILGDTIVFKSDMAGEISVPAAKVKQLRAGGTFAVLRKDAPITRQLVTPGTIDIEGDTLKVSTPATGSSSSIAVKDLAFVVDKNTYLKETNPRPGFFYGWNGVITGGATLVRSTQNGSNYNAGIALIRAIPSVPYLPKRNRTMFNLLETYGKLTQPVIPQTTPATPDSVAKTNIFHSDAERDEYINSRFYALAITSFDHNYAQGLNLQQLYGAGFGWTPIQNAKQQLDMRFDIHYEKQAFTSASSNQNLIGATFAENYTRHLPGKLIFTETADILPAFNNSNAYSANLTAGLALPVYHRLSVNFNTTDNYLNNPAVGFKKNSYQFVTGISYSLH